MGTKILAGVITFFVMAIFAGAFYAAMVYPLVAVMIFGTLGSILVLCALVFGIYSAVLKMIADTVSKINEDKK